MIFRKARLGELDMESGLGKLATLSEVDVDAVGVGGAKTFFEAKVIDLRALLTAFLAEVAHFSRYSRLENRDRARQKMIINQIGSAILEISRGFSRASDRLT